MKNKNIHIFGGGTVSHIASHFAVCAPAYGNTANQIADLISGDARFSNFKIHLELTRMAGGRYMETNEDVAAKVNELKKDFKTKIIFFNCALVDWEPTEVLIEDEKGEDIVINSFSKRSQRLESKLAEINLWLGNTKKIIPTIRNGRKDIFLVGFKTTCGATKQEMYLKGLKLCKEGSVNLVVVNDTKTRFGMIVTPEEAAYSETYDRESLLKEVIDMTWHRSHLTFTQSTVVEGKPVSWYDIRIPSSIRDVVNYCISQGAYKVFNNSTVGHFAIKLSDTEFLTSIRKSNFNDLPEIGMVYVKTDGPDTVLAYGAKPSVGGQSQRIVFKDHEGYDCIVHFHSPLKQNPKDNIPIVSQREIECGSHSCGERTSKNLASFRDGKIKAVMLDKHGPNIVFSKEIDPKIVISFINDNFDLHLKTGGYQI